jgi:hypothetical protein
MMRRSSRRSTRIPSLAKDKLLSTPTREGYDSSESQCEQVAETTCDAGHVHERQGQACFTPARSRLPNDPETLETLVSCPHEGETVNEWDRRHAKRVSYPLRPASSRGRGSAADPQPIIGRPPGGPPMSDEDTELSVRGAALAIHPSG